MLFFEGVTHFSGDSAATLLYSSTNSYSYSFSFSFSVSSGLGSIDFGCFFILANYSSRGFLFPSGRFVCKFILLVKAVWTFMVISPMRSRASRTFLVTRSISSSTRCCRPSVVTHSSSNSFLSINLLSMVSVMELIF